MSLSAKRYFLFLFFSFLFYSTLSKNTINLDREIVENREYFEYIHHHLIKAALYIHEPTGNQ